MELPRILNILKITKKIKKSKMVAEIKKYISAAILDFLKTFFYYKIYVLLTPNKSKKRLKNVSNPQSCAKKSDFDSPFWIEPPFLTKYVLELCF
jgi:hypothetical protein